MCDWKNRGFVPDSDDEEDFIVPKSLHVRDEAEKINNSSPKAVPHLPRFVASLNEQQLSTAERLEKTLEDGLQIICDVRAVTAANNDQTDLDDDSPLSSPPLSPLPSLPPSPRAASPELRSPSKSTQVAQSSGLKFLENSPNVGFHASRRGLRARAPIQEHPYMLEDAKYRQLMQDRGLKPVNIPNIQTFDAQSGPRDESQNTEDYANSPARSSFGLNISAASNSQQPETQNSASHDQLADVLSSDGVDLDDGSGGDDDDLPNLSQIFRRDNRTKKRTYKAQIDHTRGAKLPKQQRVLHSDIYDIPDDEKDRTQMFTTGTNGFQVPISPPPSGHFDTAGTDGSNDADDDIDAMDIDQGSKHSGTPMGLPTPLVSSGNGVRKRTVTIISSSESSTDEDAISERSTGDEDDSQGLKWIRQRLRGVLPPSFVKLNIGSETRTQSRQKLQQSPHKTSNERGVARRTGISSTQVVGSLTKDNIPFGEAESSDSDNSRRALPTFARSSLPSVSHVIVEDRVDIDEVEEENEIDYMLPPTDTWRRLRGKKQQTSRQSRIDDGWTVINRRGSCGTASEGLIQENTLKSGRHKEKKSATKRKKSSHKVKLPGIKILDAPGLHEVPRQSQPRFLRIAARQAHRTTQQYEQSPSKKFFSLATKADTDEVNAELKGWRTKQRRVPLAKSVAHTDVLTHHTFKTSAPAHPTTTTATHSSNLNTDSLVELDNLKQSSTALLSRIASSYKRSSPATHGNIPNIVNLIADSSQRKQPIQSKARNSYYNRSGRGQLLKRALNPRAAQVESSHKFHGLVTDLPVRTVQKSLAEPKTTASKFDKPSSSQHVRDLSNEPYSVPQRIPAKSKKRIPRRAVMESASDSPADLINTMPQEDISQKDPNNITPESQQCLSSHSSENGVSSAREIVQLLQPLPAETLFASSSLIHDQNLHELQLIFHDPKYDISILRDGFWTIIWPISKQKTACAKYDHNVRDVIANVLEETHSLLFGSDIQQELVQSYAIASTAIASTAGYFLNIAYFEQDGEVSIKDCMSGLIADILLFAELFLRSIAESYFIKHPYMRDIVLPCLNWLAILVAYFHLVATQYGIQKIEHTKSICQQIIRRMMELALQPSKISWPMGRLQMISREAAGFHISQPFVEAEAIIVAWHVLPMLARSFSPKAFYDELHTVLTTLNENQSYSSINQLSMAVKALCLVLPLTHFTVSGKTAASPSHVLDSDGASFNFLTPYINNVIAQQQSGEAQSIAGEVLEVVEDLYLKICQRWFWKPPPSVATTLLRAYAWNSMLPFNTCPDDSETFVNLDIVQLQDNDWGLERNFRDCKNDFFKFLYLTKACVDALCSEAAQRWVPRAPEKLRAFVFSMIPNNAPQTDGQTELQAVKFLALKNYFSLCATLFTGVPNGFRPRLQQLEQQVDFSTSHHRVCQLAEAAWRTLAQFYVHQTDMDRDSLKGLGEWMRSMLCQSMACFEIHNQMSGLVLLQELLTTAATILYECTSELQARLILESGVFTMVDLLMTKPETHRNNEKIMAAGLELLHAYGSKSKNCAFEDTMILKVHGVLKVVIKNYLRDDAIHTADLINSLMKAWFVTAQSMVRGFHKHWNDFVEPTSSLSIDFLSGLRSSIITYTAKCHFYSELVKADQAYFHLEIRPFVFTTWVASLLLPIETMQSQHFLTNSILEYERESLMMQDLAKELQNKYAAKELTIQDVVDNRITILRHIIQTIYGQQDCPEEEWLAGGLDGSTQKKLLDVILRTMKTTWLEMANYPVAQSDYRRLVDGILNEMETYPMEDFKIDSWFYSSEYPRARQPLENMFKCRFGEATGVITRDDIENFFSKYNRGLRESSAEAVHEELMRVFHCTDPLRTRIRDGRTQYSVDFAKQTKFLQIIFEACLDQGATHEQSFVVYPIIRLILESSERIPFRIDNLDPENMRSHIAMTIANLCVVQKFLEKTDLEHFTAPIMIRYIRAALSSFFSLVDFGIEIDDDLHETFSRNIVRIYAEFRIRLDRCLTVQETNARVQPNTTNTNDEFIVEENAGTTHNEWVDAPRENFDLIDRGENWLFFFEPMEPALTSEELELREVARRAAGRWSHLVHTSGADAGEVKEEILALFRDLKGRKLVSEEVEEEMWEGEEDE